MKVFFCLPLILASCTLGYDDASVTSTTKNGVTTTKRERMILVQGPGGTVSQKAANGASITADNQQSARDIATAVGTGVSVVEAGKTSRVTVTSNNKLDGLKAKQPAIINGQNAKASTVGEQIDANTAQFNKAVDNGAVPTVGAVQPISPP